jgi:CelD/BcsL family acetyltransferase involved in cellulose biosynthesis
VTSHPDGLIYHDPLWFEVLRRSYGYEFVGIGCEGPDGNLCGVLPLFRTRGLLTGRRLSSLPHTPVAGPLAADSDTMNCLLQAAVERAQADGGAHLQIKSASSQLSQVAEDLTGRDWEPTYVIELPSDPEAVRFGNSRNHSRIKWAVNKAMKKGVEVRAAESEAELQTWYRLYLETMRPRAVPPRPYDFFLSLWEVLRPRGHMRLLLAEQETADARTVIAGSVFLAYGQTTQYAFTGASRASLSLRPNDIIQWHAIHDACAEGHRWYDLGEVSAGDQGLADFKRKWGGEPQPLHRYYYPAPRELETGMLGRSTRPRRLASAAWARLPLGATAVFGKWLYLYL